MDLRLKDRKKRTSLGRKVQGKLIDDLILKMT